MNKTIRSGIDVAVAFTSSATRMAGAPGLPSLQAVLAETAKDKRPNKIKALLRPAARAIYRAFVPFLRPITFRVRAYLLAGLPQPPQQDFSAILSPLNAIKSDLVKQNSSRQVDSHRLDRIEQYARDQVELRQDVSSILLQLNAIKSDLIGQSNSRQIDTIRLDRIEQYALASARRVAINCGSGEILVRSEVGFILCSASDHAVLACLVESGELERGTRLLIQSFLKPNDVFIDVGANLGMHTLAAAHAMQGRGRIIAFEPFEPTQRLLSKSIWMNGFAEITEIHQAAVSNRDGHQTLFLGATSGHHSLFPLTTPSTLAPPPVEVALVRLDDVVPGGTKVDLIKIDVEGAELDVLESARQIIASNPSIALIVEFGFSHLARTDHTTKDWLAAFHALGLVQRAINVDNGQLEEWTVAQLEAVDSINLFFARPKSPAWAKAGVA